jgi:hypothetical protein
MELQFPFAVINPLCAPIDYKNYIQNIKLCSEYIIEKIGRVYENEVLFMAIGAAMEEVYNENKELWEDKQYAQLFPDYIYDHLEKNSTCRATIIIISPNISFKNMIQPLFLQRLPTEMLERIEVKIYYSLFPYYNEQSVINTTRYCETFTTLNIGSNINPFTEIIPTLNDKLFVEQFFINLGNLFNIIEQYGGCILVNSYATFKNSYNGGLGYRLCKGITNLFNYTQINTSVKRLLSEWVYNEQSTKLYVYSTNDISYSYSNNDIHLSEKKLEIQFNSYLNINFNSLIQEKITIDNQTLYISDKYKYDIFKVILSIDNNECYKLRNKCIDYLLIYNIEHREYVNSLKILDELNYIFDKETVYNIYCNLIRYGLANEDNINLITKYNIPKSICDGDYYELLACSKILGININIYNDTNLPILLNGNSTDECDIFLYKINGQYVKYTKHK